MERESGSLLNYFLRRTAAAEDAADLLGETLLIVWRRESSIPGDENQSRMWLFGIARKVLSGQRRSTNRRSALTNRLITELTANDRTVTDDVGEGVREVIGLLDEKDQEIIRLVYWDGFTLTEVAQLLHSRPATIRSRHARARTKLRNAFAQHCDPD
ncbi:sigma-70 family RNA polymerase sigma factor [Arthrobacter tumbae]|nr:RNA polymerase sigma-70 factor (ECF subfamily) [Arthrobacter tumbae]